jgi:hypothetical protein
MTKSDLEKVATKIIRLHIDSGTPPSEAASCCCHEKQLNDEQIKRVVEMANTGLFLEKFKHTSGNKDRFIDFNVIDPMSIIKSVMSSVDSSNPLTRASKTITMSLSTPKGTTVRRIVSNEPGLDSDRSLFFDNIPNEKVAHIQGVPLDYDIPLENVKTASVSTPEVSPFNQAKVEDTLRTKLAEAQINCDELSTKIASIYKDIYSREKYSSFEADALSLFGPEAVYVLQDVRSKLAMPAINSIPGESLVKEASDHHVSDVNTPGLVEAGFYLENLKSFIKVSSVLSPEVIISAGGAMVGRDFVAPITGAAGYQLATRYGPSAFYRVKGYDRMMESLIDKGMETAYDTVGSKVRDLKDSYNAKAWKKNRMKAVKAMLQNPEIASADKARVHSAVDTVARYAPKLSQDPALLTGMVNQMVNSEHGAIDPQTISELVKAEKEFRYIDKPTAYRG